MDIVSCLRGRSKDKWEGVLLVEKELLDHIMNMAKSLNAIDQRTTRIEARMESYGEMNKAVGNHETRIVKLEDRTGRHERQIWGAIAFVLIAVGGAVIRLVLR